VTSHTYGSTIIDFPSDLEVVITREFEAPIALVFDVFTKPEHVRNHFAPFGEEMTVCEIDLRVGGSYHYVIVTQDGTECSFHGTFLEIEPPARTAQTWIFDGWPDTEAIETMELTEIPGGTRLTNRMAFRDAAGRANLTKYDGMASSFNNVAAYLRSLLDG
jgi:uncharacterized protein YndB with AHSA1/START domain